MESNQNGQSTSHQSTGQVLEAPCCARHQLLRVWAMVRSRGTDWAVGKVWLVLGLFNKHFRSTSTGTSWLNISPANKSFSSESFSPQLHGTCLLSRPAAHQPFRISSGRLCCGVPWVLGPMGSFLFYPLISITRIPSFAI